MGKPTFAVIDADVGLYELEKVVASGWCFRALAQRLVGGGSLLVSPVRGTMTGSAASLEAVGAPAFALAPNHFHYMGLAETINHYPEVRAIASGVALRRLRSKCPHDLDGLDAVRERLPAGVSLLEPPGLKTGEVWLRFESERGVGWVVSDAFFNVNRALSGTMGLVLRATATAPGLRIGSTFLWLALADRQAYKRWLLARLEADAPRLLIPSHGDVVVDDDLPARLRELARRRL
ncbi:MAG: hypothetical protein KF718_20300 [Polyangiaceae bacterium]|nr:hypothetical protein [Polyangiaceae bacterium]